MSGTFREYHVGIVVDNADPEKRGRVKVECGTLLAAGVALPEWVEPTFPYLASASQNAVNAGWMFVPDVGVAVEIELSSGTTRDEVPGMVSFDAGAIKWRACLFAHGKDEIHSEFQDNYPNRRGIVTAAGHALVFDDTDGDPEVKLLQTNAQGNSFLDFTDDGSVMLAASGGMLLYMNQGDNQLTLIDNNQNILSMNGDGLYLANASSSIIQALGADISLLSGTSVLINTTSVLVSAGGMTVKNISPVQYSVLHEGLLGFSTLLAASLTEIAAGLAVFGIPTVNTAALIAQLNAAAFTSTLLKVE